MTRLNRWSGYVRERGLLWASLYAFHFLFMGIIRHLKKAVYHLDLHIIKIEKKKFLTGDATVSSLYHTTEENIKHWNSYDWSQYGNEWTTDAKKFKGLDPECWKTSLVNGMMFKYIKKEMVVLEIGPGAGRWTEILQPVCRRLLIADISEKCLYICKERFKACDNIEYHLIRGGILNFIPDNSIDNIWSYDVFIHVNVPDTEKYICEFKRILKPGGYALIHHPGTYSSEEEARKSWRSYIDGKFFARLIDKHDMRLVEQNETLAQKPGDLISVFTKLQ